MKTVLIVDDEAKLREYLARFFAARGFRTLTASSGSEAVEQLTHEVPQYLLLDIRMPDISGLDVLKFAKQQHPHLKVVMVTALQDTQLIEQAFQLGASDYVTKPFAMDDPAWARAFFAEESTPHGQPT